MQQVWKVLAPIDLADDSEAAVEHAIHVATAMDAELTLLYVANQRQREKDDRLGWPRNALAKNRPPRGIHRRVLPGKAAEMIGRYADLSAADLVLMTSENCGGWKRFWKRSVTAGVMESSRRPVWITDWKSVDGDYQFKSRTIVCVLNLDGMDEPAVKHAESLAYRSGGALVLASAVPESGEHLLYEAIGGLDRPLTARLALERMGALGAGLTVPYKTSVMTGPLTRCARLAAHRHSAGIVVASNAAPGSRYARGLGIRSVLRQLPCPLVSVPHGSAAARILEDTAVAQAVRKKVASLKG